MQHLLKALYWLVIVLLAVIGMNSCILKEYDVEGMDLEERWEFTITTPLFTGEVLLEDIIAGLDTVVTFPDKPVTEIQFSDDSSLFIATELLYEPSDFLDDFHFFISDDYDVKEGTLTYVVTNSLPFPVNLQTEFYINEESNETGIVFLPPAFAPVRYDNDTITPVTTIHEVTIPVASLEFFRRNRVTFTTWFSQPSDTLYSRNLHASVPIEISIIFSGTVTDKRED